MRAAAFLLAAVVAGASARQSEVRKMPGYTVLENVTSPRPHEMGYNVNTVPADWDWRNVSGVNYLTKSLNQHIPVYCGSCWAHGAMSSLADRTKIMRKAVWPDINFAIQVILNCGQDIAGTCDGGDPGGAFQYVQQAGGIPDDTCQQYQAVDNACSAINTCRNCMPSQGCFAQKTYKKHQIAQYGSVTGESDYMAEIYARGPIAVGIDADPLLTYTGGILYDKTGANSIDHIVSIVGWGVSTGQPGDGVPSGTKYWIVRNSWGTYWGEDGFFRIVRGVDNCAIEEDGDWAVPAASSFEEEDLSLPPFNPLVLPGTL